MSIDVVSFDFWGTLTLADDSRRQAGQLDLVTAALVRAGVDDAREVALPVCDAARRMTRLGGGDGLGPAIRSFGIAVSDDAVSELVQAMSNLTLQFPPAKVEPFHDILMAVRERGLITALACNTVFTRGTTLRRLLAEWGWLQLFDVVAFSDEVGASKPSQAFFASAFQSFDPARIVHVGDSESIDVAGIDAFGGVGVLARLNSERGTRSVTRAAAVIYDLRTLPRTLSLIDASTPDGRPTPVGTGLPVGGRIVGAPAHIVRGRLGEVPRSRIVVLGTSSPDYESVFYDAAAVVAETGGYGSHAAQFAASIGVPCIVGAKGIRDRIGNGQLIIADCDTGDIYADN